jgi:hypothetical protein
MKITYLFVRFTIKEECYAGTKIFSAADLLHKIKAYTTVQKAPEHCTAIDLARAKPSVTLPHYLDR